ncbi:MAG: LacI family DNA-binding transcriptional regulator [Mediterranea massiliensis]|nr:LacI family DNA-binding transcriptional regulator [Mediterranea massiliensis]
MKSKNYTIKDIARMAGVSAGTVDRVLHNRGDVSQVSREKVQKILDEIDYRPNMFAIGLAAKKNYHIVCVIPYFIENGYWHSVAQGIDRAASEYSSFNIDVSYCQYHYGDVASYEEVIRQLQQLTFNAVLIAPNFQEQTLTLTTYLDQQQCPYAFIDFNVEQSHPISYIGQDSRDSGYMAAKILMRSYQPGDEVVIFLNHSKNNPAQIQARRRFEGFMKYIDNQFGRVPIHELVLSRLDDELNKQLLNNFFDSHPSVTLGAVFNSRGYQVAQHLRQRSCKLKALLGYDLLLRNIEYLKSGEINYLIGQRPGLQGYCGVKTLVNSIVFKQPVPPIKYMPIDILMKENIDYYFEFE